MLVGKKKIKHETLMSAAFIVGFITGHLLGLSSPNLEAQLSGLLREMCLGMCKVLQLSSPSYWEILGATGCRFFLNCIKIDIT